MRLPLLLFFAICFCLNIKGSAQTLEDTHNVSTRGKSLPASQGLGRIISASESYQVALPLEKLFLHFDKPYYNNSDTVWFKAYLLNAFLEHSDKSGIMYLEIANDVDTVVRRNIVHIDSGLAFGNIQLSEKEFPEGHYTLRAYTNWMRNFGETYIFKKNFYIGNIHSEKWLVNYKAAFSKNSSSNLRLNLGFSSLMKQPLGLRELQLRVLSGKRELIKDKVETSVDGLLDLNFNLPEKTDIKKLLVVAKDLRKGEGNQSITIPLKIDRPQNTDVQFMPEGGKLLIGIESKIGFKAINEEGKGVDIEGSIYNSANRKVVSFKSSHSGMGAFNLLPEPGEKYTAKVRLSDSLQKDYPLPMITRSGIALRVMNIGDSLKVSMRPAADIMDSTSPYYLIGQSRGVVCYAAKIIMNRADYVLNLSKKLFPSGIAHVILLNASYQPLNERIVYIKGTDELAIEIATNQQAYSIRDSIALHITAKDGDSLAVAGSFSLAVTDDGLVRPDSLFNPNILTAMLLASELKGDIEYPGYYFQQGKEQDLDNLMLTQGWVAYNWGEVFKPLPKPSFLPEKEFQVTGSVLNAFNKPLRGVSVSLLSIKPMVVKQCLTNMDGGFTFKDFPELDTATFHIQALNKKGKSFNVGITVEEFKSPVFSTTENSMPWYVNTDSAFLKAIHSTLKLEQDLTKYLGKYLLKEVVVKGKKIVKGSKNLNGPGDADLVLDENDMLKENKTTLLQLLEKQVPGFIHKVKVGESFFAMKDKILNLIIDGFEVDNFTPEGINKYLYYKSIFDYFTAEDIKGIEVFTSKNLKYHSEYIENPLINPSDVAFIEITTRSGHGPFMKVTPGTYLYKSMPFAWPKEFYRPRYTLKSIPKEPDMRSTIHWAPNIITDANGKATISFYAADKPGSYTLILQGADLKGNLGFFTRKIVVK